MRSSPPAKPLHHFGFSGIHDRKGKVCAGRRGLWKASGLPALSAACPKADCIVVLQVISQTAIQEFKQGSAERGRSMFESCLRNYPARLDVWSQYLDQVGAQSKVHRNFTLGSDLTGCIGFCSPVNDTLPPLYTKYATGTTA